MTDRENLLATLIEEASDMQKAAARAMRSGPEESNPSESEGWGTVDDLNDAERVVEEYLHVVSLVECIVESHLKLVSLMDTLIRENKLPEPESKALIEALDGKSPALLQWLDKVQQKGEKDTTAGDSETGESKPSCGTVPDALYHVTTGRKARKYRESGCINGPVRGFDTLQGAMAWAMKTNRKVVYKVRCSSAPRRLPDHHNQWGSAWWTDTVPMKNVKCVYSAEGAWSEPAKKPELVWRDTAEHGVEELVWSDKPDKVLGELDVGCGIVGGLAYKGEGSPVFASACLHDKQGTPHPERYHQVKRAVEHEVTIGSKYSNGL